MEHKGGQRLTMLRTQLGWTQPELASKADISVMTVSRIENASQKEMDSYKRTINKLADQFGVNANWLLTGKGSIWLTGTDEENVARIKSMKSGTQSGTNDQAVEELKVELVRYREREDRLQRIIDKLIGGGNSFRKALSGTSYAKTA